MGGLPIYTYDYLYHPKT